jgi:hypothetical protein
VLYFDNLILTYPNIINNFSIINIKTPVAVSDTFYIAYRQITDDMITIGWDRNTNHAEKLFFKTGSNWLNYKKEYPESNGTMMIRPVFGNYNFLLNPKKHLNRSEISIYPNPAQDIFYVNSNISIDKIFIYNTLGNEILNMNYNASGYDITTLQTGTYIVKIKSSLGYSFAKLIKN